MQDLPQGSVLGSFLFLLYINDISNGLAYTVRLSADDTKLYATVACDINNVTSSLNDDLETIILWSNRWAINFNPFKTVIVDFSRKKFTISRITIRYSRTKNFTISISHPSRNPLSVKWPYIQFLIRQLKY